MSSPARILTLAFQTSARCPTAKLMDHVLPTTSTPIPTLPSISAISMSSPRPPPLELARMKLPNAPTPFLPCFPTISTSTKSPATTSCPNRRSMGSTGVKLSPWPLHNKMIRYDILRFLYTPGSRYPHYSYRSRLTYPYFFKYGYLIILSPLSITGSTHLSFHLKYG